MFKNKIFLTIIILLSLNAFCSNIPDLKNISNFTDSFLKENAKKFNIKNYEFAVVSGTQTLLKSDSKTDPDNNQFCIGSVSKLFAYASILQIYDRGLLNIEDDITKYLKDINISNPYNTPVKIKHLLTHTSGIEEVNYSGSWAESHKDLITAGQFLKSKKLSVVNKPGEICLYSNIGPVLLGHIVENITGMKYGDYLKKYIFIPLNMKNTYYQVIPKNTVKGYFDGGEAPFYYQQDAMAGGIYSTAGDMAKFMLANLNSSTILKKETFKLFHSQHFTSDPVLPGMTYGFMEKFYSNTRTIEHFGAVPGYFSHLFLIPEINSGIFITANDINDFVPLYQQEFMNKFFGSPLKETYVPLKNKSNYSELAGKYRTYHDSSKITIAKTSSLFGEETEIFTDKDGSLMITETDFMKKIITTGLTEIKPLVFQRNDNKGFIVFKRDSEGKIKYLFNNTPYDTFEKIQPYEYASMHVIILLVSLITFIVMLIHQIIKIFSKKNYDKSYRTKRIFTFFTALFNLTGLIGFFLMTTMFYLNTLAYNKFYFLFVIFISMLNISAVLVVPLIYNSIKEFKKSCSGIEKILYPLYNMIYILFIFFLYYWNILGFKF